MTTQTNISRYFHDLAIGFESIQTNKIKSFLTALGIIFGVAAVISMLAIGNGAQSEILAQIKLVGVNNIIITPIQNKNQQNTEEKNADQASENSKKFSPGLTILDLEAITSTINVISAACPIIEENKFISRNGKGNNANILAVSADYFKIYNIEITEGETFKEIQSEDGMPVCIIGPKVKLNYFNNQNPVGGVLKVGNEWLKVVGVIEKRDVSAASNDKMGISDLNDKVFIPLKTMLMRYRNRGIINPRSENEWFDPNANINQLDKIVIQVQETEQLQPVADVVKRMLYRRHAKIEDFEITIPEMLLKQQQKTKDIFNIVLGAIAGISLLVGGIGIMNIMLATVMERVQEIGTRRALGANKQDIIVQFLSEAVIISVSGGIIGILAGIILSKLVTRFSEILTIVSPFSVLIAFGVSVSIGVLFGYLPAKRAANLSPIDALRSQ